LSGQVVTTTIVANVPISTAQESPFCIIVPHILVLIC